MDTITQICCALCECVKINTMVMKCCNKSVCYECTYKWDAVCGSYVKCMFCLSSIKKICFKKISSKELIQIIVSSSNIKQCPRCNICIEKIGGCKRMTCKCGKEFCFDCGASYCEHARSYNTLCQKRKWIMSSFLGIRYQKSL